MLHMAKIPDKKTKKVAFLINGQFQVTNDGISLVIGTLRAFR